MPLERFYNLPEDKRTRILDAARAEFAAHGGDASYNRIIAAAGISKGAMYYYFSDRDDLFGEVIAQAFARMLTMLGPVEEPSSAEAFWATFDDVITRATMMITVDPELTALGKAFYQSAAGDRAYQRVKQRFVELVERALEVGQGVGAIRTDVPTDMLVAALTSMGFGVDAWFAERMDTLSPEAMHEAERAARRLFRDLASPPG